MTNKLKIGLVVLGLIIIGGVAFINTANKKTATNSYTAVEQTQNIPTTNPSKTPPKTNTTTTTKPSSYTMAEVSTHNNAQSCWTAISGNVYDVTTWINQHPGGAGAILSLCGKDGTEAFVGQHGGQRRPEQELQSFLIGALK